MFTTDLNEATIFVANTKLDIHEDTVVAGANFTVLSFTYRSCDGVPYNDKYRPNKGIPVFQAVIGYIPACGRKYIQILNEALWMPELHH